MIADGVKEKVEDQSKSATPEPTYEYPMSIEKTNKGSIMLVDSDGFQYVKDKISKDKILWKCRKTHTCKGRIKTVGPDFKMTRTQLHKCDLPW